MAITLNRLYAGTHQYDAGTVQINIPFVGNTLAVELTTKPEYANTDQRIGTLYQFYGTAQKAYDLFSGKDIVKLELPETDKLWFSPTSYLSDNYILNIDYTNIGAIINGSNSISIPEQILGLPTRVTTLENTPAVSAISWDNITNKPLTFNPSEHSHLMSDITGLAGELATFNTDIHNAEIRIDALEQSAPVSANSISYVSISTSLVLQSNKSYLAIAPDLICSLPVSPVIGDVINLATGNFSLKIKHSDNVLQVLNSNTLSAAGVDNGIILKPYADISLICLGSNLWKSVYRSRIINNFSPAILESVANKKSYTASSPDIALAYNTAIAFIYNGVKLPTGSYSTDGLLANNATGSILITFAEPIILESLILYNGQGNNSLGSGSNFWTSSMTVYVGNSTLGANLGSLFFVNSTGTEQAKTLTPNSTPATQFLLSVSSPNTLGILELEFFGKTATGGEISV